MQPLMSMVNYMYSEISIIPCSVCVCVCVYSDNSLFGVDLKKKIYYPSFLSIETGYTALACRPFGEGVGHCAI